MTQEIPRVVGLEIGRKFVLESSEDDYSDFLASTIKDNNLEGLTIAIDSANGATSYIAPKILESLGAKVLPINHTPDGTNINANSGSTHINVLSKFVKSCSEKVDIGFAFDGDGDRVLAVDEKGETIDGDQILSVLGLDLKNKGLLKNNTIVATVMSNLGLKIFGDKENINIATTDIGDRSVLEYMLKNDCNLGGEQSGHIILSNYNTTGDGILTALQLSAIIKSTKTPVSQLVSKITILPQVLVNAKVNSKIKHEFAMYKEIQKAIEVLENKFDGSGRVLIRPSGTEPLVRVMIEGIKKEEIEKDARELANLIEDIMY
ncbi:MAG: hypothetical protein ACK5LV_08920 [Lachnospirales bacterium]